MASKSTINITFKLDGDSKGFKDLAQQADGLKVVMQSAAVEAEKFQASVINWSQGVQALSAVSNAVGNLNNSLSSITAESNAFNAAMRSANTMAGYGAEDFDKLRGKVADLAKQIPVARDELANGLYQVISNGVPEDNWISFLEASARSSVGGIANLGEAVTVTSTIIKNYGLAWEDAQSIQDKIQLTAKNGVTSFEQLAGALPAVAGSAATLGVSIDELMSVFATCTGVTGNTAEVSTQLNAVLKALIKPTSEATAAADKMGIAFNAAAVKEAGGLDNFLKMVDTTIRDYAARTGELSETIYGNLFGSSRALRLLTSLTGEQSAKFTENIAIMTDSAGTMDAAYEQMSNTVQAQSQILQNYINSLTDVVAGIIAPYQPAMNLIAQLGQMSISMLALVKSMTMLRGGLTTIATLSKTLVGAVTAITTSQGRAAIATSGWGNAARMAVASMTGLQVAIRGLLIASGIGAVFTAVTLIIQKFADSARKAKEPVEELGDTTDTFKDTMVNAQSEMSNEIRRLDDLIKSHRDTSRAVAELNSRYGDIFGTYKTAQEWKDRLTRSSQAYCEQLAYEAKLIEANKRLIDLQFQGNELGTQLGDIIASGSTRTYSAGGGARMSDEYKDITERIKENDEAQAQVKKEIDACNKGLEKARTNLNGIVGSSKSVATNMSGVSSATSATTRGTDQQKTRLQEINEALTQLTNAYVTQGDDQRESIQMQINALNDERAQIELLQAQAARPLSLDSLTDIDAEIAYQNKLLKTVSAEEAQSILQVIEQLQDERKAYSELTEAVREPIALGDIKNIQECSDAIDYYSDLQKTASADEYSDIQKVINAYEAKADAIRRGADLLDFQSDIDSLSNLSTRELRIKIRAEGYDSFVDKINDLRGMLNDNINPVSDDQKNQIEDLIDAYTRLARQSAVSFGTLRDGWSDVKGISGGIDDITSALTESGTAWEKITSIIDGFLEIYEGLNKIVSIIDALTLASGLHAKQKQQEGVAAQEAAEQEVAAAAEVAAAEAVEQAATTASTTANVADAASETFKAHASIPFVGIAIAAGLIATMLAVMSSLKFAKGGIAYGPTLGLFGEYANASTNPEVVAPLDRLRSLLKTDEATSGRVRFTIEGRTLVGVLEREYNVRNRR